PPALELPERHPVTIRVSRNPDRMPRGQFSPTARVMAPGDISAFPSGPDDAWAPPARAGSAPSPSQANSQSGALVGRDQFALDKQLPADARLETGPRCSGRQSQPGV